MAAPAHPRTTTVALLHGVWVCLAARCIHFFALPCGMFDVMLQAPKRSAIGALIDWTFSGFNMQE